MSNVTQQPERKYEVRLAQNAAEVDETLRLRYDIFNQELGEGLPESHDTKKDKDEYDQFCDHLIVIDQANKNKIVGTYRILRTSVARANIGFYSENEFDMSHYYDLPDEIMELGRSCVHPDYRDGTVMTNLWGGLAWYVNTYKIRYMIGCASVHSLDTSHAAEIYAYFREKDLFIQKDLWVEPKPEYRIPDFNPDLKVQDLKEIQRNIPGLILGYVRAGARIGSPPALDKVFKTTDFFVVFDSHKVEERYGKKYRSAEYGYTGEI
jgi:L-ornithine Nalpha-acyltransferase